MDAIELMKVQARGMAVMVKQSKTDFFKFGDYHIT